MQPSLRRTAVVIWLALVAGVALFAGVALAVPLGGSMDQELAVLLLLVALGMTVLSVGISFWLPRRIRPAGAVATPDQLALTRTIIASSLCEGPALFAVVGFMVTRDAGMLLPWLLSVAALLSHFPGARRWERLGGGAAGGAAGGAPPGGPAAGSGPPSRMVRE